MIWLNLLIHVLNHQTVIVMHLFKTVVFSFFLSARPKWLHDNVDEWIERLKVCQLQSQRLKYKRTKRQNDVIHQHKILSYCYDVILAVFTYNNWSHVVVVAVVYLHRNVFVLKQLLTVTFAQMKDVDLTILVWKKVNMRWEQQ